MVPHRVELNLSCFLWRNNQWSRLPAVTSRSYAGIYFFVPFTCCLYENWEKSRMQISKAPQSRVVHVHVFVSCFVKNCRRSRWSSCSWWVWPIWTYGGSQTPSGTFVLCTWHKWNIKKTQGFDSFTIKNCFKLSPCNFVYRHQTLRRNLLTPSSTPKMEAICFFEILVTIYKPFKD